MVSAFKGRVNLFKRQKYLILQASTLIRQHRNRVEALKNSDGDWITAQDELENLVLNYFQSLFFQDNSGCIRIPLPFSDCWNYGSLTIEMVATPLPKMEASIIKYGGFKYGGFNLSKIWPPTIHFSSLLGSLILATPLLFLL